MKKVTRLAAEVALEIMLVESRLSEPNYNRLARIAFRTEYGTDPSICEFIESNRYDAGTHASEIARDYVWAALENN